MTSPDGMDGMLALAEGRHLTFYNASAAALVLDSEVVDAAHHTEQT